MSRGQSAIQERKAKNNFRAKGPQWRAGWPNFSIYVGLYWPDSPTPMKPRCEQWIVAPGWPWTGHLFAMGSWGAGKRSFMSGALRVSSGGVWISGWCLPVTSFCDKSYGSCHERLQEMPWTLLMLLSFAALALGNGADTRIPQKENWTQSATKNDERFTFRLWHVDIQDYQNQG